MTGECRGEIGIVNIVHSLVFAVLFYLIHVVVMELLKCKQVPLTCEPEGARNCLNWRGVGGLFVNVVGVVHCRVWKQMGWDCVLNGVGGH
jgi:hypothetical protein